MTFDLDLWPTDLTIDRDHLLIKDYLPAKFEASGAKRCWVIRCTRFGRLTWPLTLTFDLLTWLSIVIIYSSRTIYLPSLKLPGKVFSSFQLHNVKGYGHTDRHVQRNMPRFEECVISQRSHWIVTWSKLVLFNVNDFITNISYSIYICIFGCSDISVTG